MRKITDFNCTEAFENLIEAFRTSCFIIIGVALAVLGFHLFALLTLGVCWAVLSLVFFVKETIPNTGMMRTVVNSYFLFSTLIFFSVMFVIFSETGEKVQEKLKEIGLLEPYCLLGVVSAASLLLFFIAGIMGPPPPEPLTDLLMDMIFGSGGSGEPYRPGLGWHRM